MSTSGAWSHQCLCVCTSDPRQFARTGTCLAEPLLPAGHEYPVYIFLLIILRISGKRSLAQITTFDFVLLLIIAEASQQALLGDDYSITNAVLVIDRGAGRFGHRIFPIEAELA